MKKTFLLSLLILLSTLGFGQDVHIGDILCTDGSTVRPEQFASSGKTAEGIVFYVDEIENQGWAVSLECQAVNTHWVTEAHYYDMYDIPDLENFEYSREAIYDLDGYSNTGFIRLAHGADWYPAAWSVDFDHGWYLPAAGQLRWMMAYINEINASLAVVHGTTFTFNHPRWYWASTERTYAHAVVVSQTGSVANYPKWNYIGEYEIGVRAVKTFSVPSPSHHIGEVVTTPDGQKGVVYYISPDDGSYWLVALNDLPSSYPWGPETDITSLNNYNESNQYVKLHGVHCGYDATFYMRQANGSSSPYVSSQVDFDHGWHIPSAGQLSKLFAALPFIESVLTNNGGSTLSENCYWTSTECSPYKAWTVNYGTDPHTAGIFAAREKSYSYPVRPVWSEPCNVEPPLPTPGLPDNILEGDCNAPLQGFEWGIREEWSSGSGIYCRINPLVGDLDDDGIPEIVCFDMQDNNPSQPLARTINVYDGRTKARKAQIHLADYIWAHGNGPYGLVKLPNRKSLIVAAGYDTKLYAYDITNANPSIPVWISNESYNTGNLDHSVSLGFADFNGDSHPEIYVRNKIFDAETGILLATAQGGNNQANSYSHGSHTNHNKLSCPIAFDICGDTRQELILGNEIYDVVITNRNGTSGNYVTLAKTVTPPNGIIADGHVQVADFNLDGHPDILVSNRNTDDYNGEVAFYVWDVHNERTSLPVQLSTNFIGKSIPLIADFDNDGFLEILIDCCNDRNSLLAYRFNPGTNSFNYLWSLPIDEDSYSNTATLFDFNNDGKNELVYTDNSNLLVFDLSTAPPSEISKIDCGEITIMQVPIVADIDNDGSAEIVVTGKAGGYMQASTKLKVFKSSTEPWRAARKVWNQYMYHVTNVNEDLTIPTFCFNTASVFTETNGTIRRPYNNFLQQAGYITPTGEPYNPSGYVEAEHYGEGCETYHFNGVTYTESGDYEYLIENPLGCDTLLTIHVHLSDTVHASQYKNVCSPYTWNGIIYEETGIYQQTFTSMQGCDSIVTLYLNVGEQIMSSVVVNTCDNYTWNGTTYTESGLYEQTFTSAQGCDSIVVLDLTIKSISHVSQIHGENLIFYQTNGTYTYSIDSVLGCFGYEWSLDGPWNLTSSPDSPECSVNINSPGTATLKVRVYTECGYIERTLFINHDARPDIVIYPNPTKGEFNIVLYGMQGEAVIVIYDYLGQFIDRLNVNTDLEGTVVPYSLAGKAAGVYLINVMNNHKKVCKKVIKETASSYGMFLWR